MKRKLALLLLILIPLFLVGCWDMREINEIGIVEAVGLDFIRDTNKYTVTVQIVNSKGSSSSSEKGGLSESVWIGSAEGSTIFEAIRNLSKISSKRITWSHNTIIVIGESFAKNDITPAVDFFTHSPELRMKTTVVVSKGDAKKYIASKAGLDSLTGISLANIAKQSKLPAVSLETDMLSLNSEFSSDYSQILLSAVNFEKSVLTSDDSNKVNEISTIILEGAAVFKKNKMIGWLSHEEARGLAWVLNNTKNTIVTVNDYSLENSKVSLETRKVKSKITSEIVKGIPNITIKITGRGNIVEQDGFSKLSAIEFQKQIESSLNEEIKDEINTGVYKVQRDYESDVLGLAQIVKAQNSHAWKGGIKDKWKEIFPNIPINIDVDIDINSNTLKQEPLKDTKGK